MHTHLVAAVVWRYRQGQHAAPLLRRIATEQLVLVSPGASDWLDSSGRAERVNCGFRITACKFFGSGSPAGDLLMTSAPYEDPEDGPSVLHFPLPLAAEGVTVLDNWRTMGMRGSGSNDVLLERVFVPEHEVTLPRPRGRWHPFLNLSVIVATPLVMSIYLGVAEAARDLALQRLRRKRDDPDVWYLVGEFENALINGQLAVQGMVDLCADYAFAPDVQTANVVLAHKTIAASSLLAAGEKALEAVGGAGLFRGLRLERLLRDLHGAQVHPLPQKRQLRFTGRVALGLEPVG
jgi:alkylation response protein AidB-like acyl-CoA dehydrogenase